MPLYSASLYLCLVSIVALARSGTLHLFRQSAFMIGRLDIADLKVRHHTHTYIWA